MASPLKRKTPDGTPNTFEDLPKRQRVDGEGEGEGGEETADNTLPEDVVEEENHDEIEEGDIDLDEEIVSESEESDAEDGDSASDSDSDSTLSDEESTSHTKKLKKRNDPSAFAQSISKILSSKVSTSKSKGQDSQDPVLARSKSAVEATQELNTSRLEGQARRKIREEKRERLDKGRIVDVLGLQSTKVSTSEIQEREKRYKKIAQRGAVLLFNAIRAAQREAEKAIVASKSGDADLGGRNGKDEKISEMSKKGFLELIAGGGKK